MGLPEPDRAKDEDGSTELADAECLVENDPTGHGSDNGAEESEHADLGDGEELHTSEPEAVGDRGAECCQPQKAHEVRCGKRGRESFDADGEW